MKETISIIIWLLISTTVLPVSPTGLLATSITSTSVNLTWFDNADNETSYTIEWRFSNAAEFDNSVSTSANSTSFEISGLQGESEYVFRVVAVNDAGLSGYSNNAYATTPNQCDDPTITCVDNVADANQALSTAIHGDEIVVLDGLYSDWHINIAGSGITDDAIVFRAETPGGVTFTGNSRISVEGNHIVIKDFKFVDAPENSNERVIRLMGADFCIVTQCQFVRCGAHKWKHILFLGDGADYNEISYNTFDDLVGQGIGVGGSGIINKGNHIHHNHINGVVDDGEYNGQEPIQLGQDSYNEMYFDTLVEYNLIENQGGDGDGEMISVKTRGSTIRYNTLRHDNQRVVEREISLRDAAETLVEGNFLFGTCIRAFGVDHIIRGNYIEGAFGNPERGIRLPLWGSGSYPLTENILIEENVVVGTYVSAIEIACGADNPVNLVGGNIVVQNNVSQGDDGVLYRECNPSEPATYGGNTGWGNATLFSGMSGDGIIEQNQNLIHDGGFWHLPNDNNPNHPLTSDDVGPEWLGGPQQ